jgi:hypothetical protein
MEIDNIFCFSGGISVFQIMDQIIDNKNDEKRCHQGFYETIHELYSFIGRENRALN